MPLSKTFVLFGVNIGNLGKSGHRPKSPQLCKSWNEALGKVKPRLQVHLRFGHTGNFILTSENDTEAQFALSHLHQILQKKFAVFSKEEYIGWVEQGIQAFGQALLLSKVLQKKKNWPELYFVQSTKTYFKLSIFRFPTPITLLA